MRARQQGLLCDSLACLQELTINYQPGVLHRSDLSLYIYGQLGRWGAGLHSTPALPACLPRSEPSGMPAGLPVCINRSRIHVRRRCHHTPAHHTVPGLAAGAGFVIPREQPLLASVDLPGFDAWDVFKQTPPDDSAHDGEACRLLSCR